MTLYEPNRLWLILFSIFNPFPKRIKVIRQGKYVLDLRGWWISRRVQKLELARRQLAGEEERQCFMISPKGSVEVSGSTK